MNLRCFDQKRRFGIDFLNKLDRYTNALTKDQVPNRAGELVDNPLFPRPNPETGEISPAPREEGWCSSPASSACRGRTSRGGTPRGNPICSAASTRTRTLSAASRAPASSPPKTR